MIDQLLYLGRTHRGRSGGYLVEAERTSERRDRTLGELVGAVDRPLDYPGGDPSAMTSSSQARAASRNR